MEEQWVYRQLVMVLSLQIWRNAYATNSDCLPQPIQRRCMKSVASYSLPEQMSRLTSRLSSARTVFVSRKQNLQSNSYEGNSQLAGASYMYPVVLSTRSLLLLK